MKISCQSCQAKYTIADEKVLGKIVKIRCKKCSATIVINGNETAAASMAPAGDPNVFDYTAQGGGGGEQWTVNVADGDQRTLSSAEVADAYRQGVVNDETYCWKDGMSDWLPLREIEALYAAATLGPRPSLAPDGGMPHADEGPTRIQESNLGSLFGGGGGVSPPQPEMMAAAAPESNGHGAGAFYGGAQASAASSGPAARRAGGRGAQGADLFGGVAQAGGEEDVMTSAPSGMPGSAHPPAGDGKLTGQRNENSVLFSLTALTQNAPKEDKQPMGEGSGLIDIRALSASMETKDQKGGSRIDDIMNLAGGGAFTPALAAPVLGPPALDNADYGASANTSQQGGNNKTLLFAILGGAGILVIGAIIITMLLLGNKKPDATTTPGLGTATTTNTLNTPGTGTGAPTGTSTDTSTAATATTATNPTASATTTATATATTTAAAARTNTTTGTTPPPATATAQPTVVKPPPPATGPCGCAKGDVDCAIRCSVKKH